MKTFTRGYAACALSLLALAASLVSGCQRRETPPAAPSPAPHAASAPLAGITPSPDLTGASDKSGPPALGALEAGQAKGGAKVGGAPQATGGDGAASAPPPPSR